MFIVKKNDLFESTASGNLVRAITKADGNLVTIASLDNRNRADKTTARTVQIDSLRRRYARV